MAKAKRVIFTFDDRSFDTLQRITEQAGLSSMAESVRESIQINRALQDQAARGFTEVVVRNPDTREERVIVIPNIQQPRPEKRT
jgi:hypothetical protein